MVQRRGHAQSQRLGRNQSKLPVRVARLAHCSLPRAHKCAKPNIGFRGMTSSKNVTFSYLLILNSIVDYACIQKYTSLDNVII